MWRKTKERKKEREKEEEKKRKKRKEKKKNSERKRTTSQSVKTYQSFQDLEGIHSDGCDADALASQLLQQLTQIHILDMRTVN
jgi:hypothetical protein